MIEVGRRQRRCRLCSSFDHDARKCPDRHLVEDPPPPPGPPLPVITTGPVKAGTGLYVTLLTGDEFVKAKNLANQLGCSVSELMAVLLDHAPMLEGVIALGRRR